MSSRRDDGQYVPIDQYGLIGNCRSAALISREGSIDWYCPDQFDNPAVFARLLDAGKGGFWEVCPTAEHRTERRYLPETSVLETTYFAGDARAQVLDFMPMEDFGQGPLTHPAGPPRIVRRLRGIQGTTEFSVRFRATGEYGTKPGTVEVHQDDPSAIVAHCGNTYLALAGVRLEVGDHDVWTGTLAVGEGEQKDLVMVHRPGRIDVLDALAFAGQDDSLDQTCALWKEWADRCTYRGKYRNQVVRSALTLKLLTFDPTGAVVAAPTTSLPEQLGGVRNWDYRFTWLRDSSLILYALLTIGYHGEASRFLHWLQRVVGRNLHKNPQIMYTIDGDPDLPEKELTDLDGYRGSRPVRIGNAAVDQRQLDIFGELLTSAYIHYHKPHEDGHAMVQGYQPDSESWRVLKELVEDAAGSWQEPDNGIWEVRGGPRHFLYSKLMCWAALDRGIRLVEEHGLEADLDRWRKTRDDIRHAIETRGFNPKKNAFVQSFGSDTVDAAALAIPRLGFLPATDPRVLSTIEAIQRDLTKNGLVYRYLSSDGLPGGEGAFLLCTFWLVEALALTGQTDEALQLFEGALGHANELGLYSEELDPATGEFLGNFPQGFTHLALIRAAVDLATAQKHGPEHHATTEGQRAHKAYHAARKK